MMTISAIRIGEEIGDNASEELKKRQKRFDGVTRWTSHDFDGAEGRMASVAVLPKVPCHHGFSS